MQNISNSNDNWPDMPKLNNVYDIFSFGCSIAVIFGGLIPYIPQYLTIKTTLNSDGFSTYVCLTLLLANIMRILFWFGHRFELPLLIQSFVMILGMLAMMDICVRVRNKYPRDNMISTVSTMAPSRSRRRFLIGKIWPSSLVRLNTGINDTRQVIEYDRPAHQDEDGLPNESSPIYSVPQTSTNRREPCDSSESSDLFYSLSYQQDGQINSKSISDPSNSSSSVNTNQKTGDSMIDHDHISVDQLSFSGVRVSQTICQHSEYHQQQSSSTMGLPSPGSSANLLPQVAEEDLVQQNQQNHYQNLSSRTNKCLRGSVRHFWDWDDFGSYLQFLLLFISIGSLATYLLIDCSYYIETLGFIAVLTESMLGLPQLLRNYTKKSTLGMSVEMVIMWLSGDLFKTLYFILRKTPAQFYVCGSIQVLMDILILVQVFWYGRPNVTYRKLPKFS